MKREDKSGQFYLIAAMAIIAVIIGLTTISNSFKTSKGPETVYVIGEEIDIEIENVLNYGTTQELDLLELMENFTGVFTNSSKELEFYFVIGNTTDLRTYKDFNGVRETISNVVEGNNITITVYETNYTFKLKTGQNFYYMILDKDEDETYITSNL